jgi:fluoroacetyl-CoA thioesterase
MKSSLKPGLKHSFSYALPGSKTVPHLYREAPQLQAMPEVFATGFMVGLMEWTCVQLLEAHLDPGEGSLGVHVDVSHKAASVPGQVVKVDATCTSVNGRRIVFEVVAHDGIEVIGDGRHERMIVPWARFVQRVNEKARQAGVAPIAAPGG